MKPSEVRDVLAGAGARAPGPSDPAIDGMSPSLVLEPESIEMAQRVLAVCQEEKLAVVPLGGATRAHVGNLAAHLDAFLMTRRLDRIEAYEPRDETITVEGGVRLKSLQTLLRTEKQFMPWEPPQPDRATVGGILAAGESGWRRSPGSRPRDLLLGCEIVLADGSRVKTGGRVVKNVTGYELAKLFLGSRGTLGLLARAHLRVRPLPERVVTLVAALSTPDMTDGVLLRLAHDPHGPEVILLIDPLADILEPVASEALGQWAVVLRFEGLEEEVQAALSRARDILKSAPSWELDERTAEAFWTRVGDFSVPGAVPALPIVVRGQVKPADTFPLAERWRSSGLVLGYPLNGVVYARASTADIPTVEAQQGLDIGPTVFEDDAYGRLLAEARALGGNAVLEAAPVDVKAGIDVFGELPGGLDLMRRIKQKIDPKAILSPGRFVARF